MKRITPGLWRLRNGTVATVKTTFTGYVHGKPLRSLCGCDAYGNPLLWGLDGRHMAGGYVMPDTRALDIVSKPRRRDPPLLAAMSGEAPRSRLSRTKNQA